jgi:virginiamycin B lyase
MNGHFRAVGVGLMLGSCLAAACRGPDARSSARSTHVTPAVSTVAGRFVEYPLPQKNSGMMWPAVDREGRVWFGEMNHNCLTVFDPRTQAFKQIPPPGGAFGIMGLVVADDGSVWFAEEYANYIGRYVPGAGTFATYGLPTVTRPDPGHQGKMLSLPSAPNDLALDAGGNVWFTESNAGALGRIDVRTGTIRHFSVTTGEGRRVVSPFSVAIDAQGIAWFTSTDAGDIGRLDPADGSVRTFTIAGLPPGTTLMEIAVDARGAIWATSFASGLLIRLDPRDGSSTSWTAPPGTGGLYGLHLTIDGGVWVAVTDANAIARLDPTAGRFEYYAIPTNHSVPLGASLGTDGALWFAESGSDKLGMLDTARRNEPSHPPGRER